MEYFSLAEYTIDIVATLLSVFLIFISVLSMYDAYTQNCRFKHDPMTFIIAGFIFVIAIIELVAIWT